MSTAVAVSDAPTSLAISPNLDALLEHDERMRQLTTVEGILRDVVTDLGADQPLRRIQAEDAYKKIEHIIDAFVS